MIEAGQRLCRQMGQGLAPGQRVRSAGGQLACQQTGGMGEQILGDQLGREKCAQIGQLGGCCVLVGQPSRDFTAV
jgi:hypothetical protein